MVDDSPKNLALAKDFQINTVLISDIQDEKEYPFVDHRISVIYQIGEIISSYI